MKTLSNFFVIGLFSGIAVFCQAQQATTVPPPTPFSVVGNDANSRTWERTTYSLSPSGKVIPQAHRVVETATGLNYWNGNQWSLSDPSFQVSADGQTVFANKLQHQVQLSANLNASSSVSITTPDGIVLNTTPVAIGLYDPISSNSVIIAGITNCSGTLVSSNVAVFENAFDDVSANVVYTVKRGSFSQDVVLEQNINPADYGCSTNALIQIYTEFYQAPTPNAVGGNLYFGKLFLGPGRAYAGATANQVGGAPVTKSFTTLNGRTFLVESVKYASLQKELEALPPATASQTARAKTIKSAKDYYAAIPSPHPTAKSTVFIRRNQPRMAKIDNPKGVWIDYDAVDGTMPEPMVFQGDTTYFISGEVDCDDVIFEGGTILKYPNDTTAFIYVSGGVNCLTTPYQPFIATAGDDDSVGVSMNGVWGGYSGTISGTYANPALLFDDTNAIPTISNARFCYAAAAEEMDDVNYSGYILTNWDVQFFHCWVGASIGSSGYEDPYLSFLTFNNCLFVNGKPVVDNLHESAGTYVNFVNCTVDNCSQVFSDPQGDSFNAQANNSVFSDLPYRALDYLEGNNNGFYNTVDGPFGIIYVVDYNCPYQIVGGGTYYLADNTFRGQGNSGSMSSALVADLATKTTWPPIVYDSTNISSLGTLSPDVPRDTNTAPDLGYHYSPVDYAFGGCDIYSNSLTFTPGTAIACYGDGDSDFLGWPYGISVDNGANLYFDGNATQPCILAFYDMVQEGGNGNWTDGEDGGYLGSVVINGTNTAAQVSADFTKWTDDNEELMVFDTQGAANFLNCEFYNSGINTHGALAWNFTNCLFFRDSIISWSDINFSHVNCTFYNGLLIMSRSGSPPASWLIENCAFDGTAISWSDAYNGSPTYTTMNYNAYNTNNLSWETYPYSPAYGTNEIVGLNDVMVTNYNWESSWFGNFYLPTNSPLLGMGSTNANLLGLYEFTTQTNQTPEGTNIVDIGYHYVATDGNGNPLDTYVPGIPNYIVDTQGNGMDANGLAYWWEALYFGQIGLNPDSDPDGDGFDVLYAFTNGLNPNNLTTINPIMLGSWNFDNTNTWMGNQGQLPTTATNLVGVPSWETNAVVIDSANAILSYGNLQTNGEANFNLRNGTICWWFSPNWASTNSGGVGPQNEGRFIEIGSQGTTNGWWSLAVDSSGTNIYFGTQTNSISTLTTNLVAPINLESNVWHQIILTYTTNNSSLYIDGEPVVTNGLGVSNYPSLTVQANGFTIGSSLYCTNQAAGAFDELSTYNYPLNAGTIFTNYENLYSIDSNGDGLSDIWEWSYFGTLSINTNALDPDGLTTYQNYVLGTDPVADQSGQSNSRSNYSYTLADWLDSISGARSGSITLDNEGNVQSVSQ